MELPWRRLKKDEFKWLAGNLCKSHGHSYLSHYACFIKENPKESPLHEKIGFFDLETSGLKADFAFIFSYAIRGNDNKLYGRVLRPDEIQKGVFDKYLVAEMVKDLKRFHRVVVHYGGDRRFDCPFARTRALKHGLEFPLYKDIWVSDTWLMSKNKLKLRSNKLGVICEFFGIKAKAHPLTPDIWMTACAGEQKSLDYIWTHNQEDVDSMRKVYNLLRDYSPRNKVSI
jgi:uncharacterized protein YprB with RNaseH-like and TPR domain